MDINPQGKSKKVEGLVVGVGMVISLWREVRIFLRKKEDKWRLAADDRGNEPPACFVEHVGTRLS